MGKYTFICALILITLSNQAMQRLPEYNQQTTSALRLLLNQQRPTKSFPETIIMSLILAGADPDVEADEGFYRNCTWLYTATRPYNPCGYSILVFLLRNGANPNKKKPLLKACRDGDYASVDLLLAYGADINELDNNRNSVLLCAIRDSQYPNEYRDAIVKLLLDRGASSTITVPDKDGRTALSWARTHKMNTILKLFEPYINNHP